MCQNHRETASLSAEAAEARRQIRARANGLHTSGQRQPVRQRWSDTEKAVTEMTVTQRWQTQRWQPHRDGSDTETAIIQKQQ